MFNGKALRRFHLKTAEPSIEGIARRRPRGGVYDVERAKWVDVEPGTGKPRTTTLDGVTEIPAADVLYVQRLG